MQIDASAVTDGVKMERVSRQTRFQAARLAMLRYWQEERVIRLLKTGTEDMRADILSKPLNPSSKFGPKQRLLLTGSVDLPTPDGVARICVVSASTRCPSPPPIVLSGVSAAAALGEGAATTEPVVVLGETSAAAASEEGAVTAKTLVEIQSTASALLHQSHNVLRRSRKHLRALHVDAADAHGVRGGSPR
jgi:hypothetical protein